MNLWVEIEFVPISVVVVAVACSTKRLLFPKFGFYSVRDQSLALIHLHRFIKFCYEPLEPSHFILGRNVFCFKEPRKVYDHSFFS